MDDAELGKTVRSLIGQGESWLHKLNQTLNPVSDGKQDDQSSLTPNAPHDGSDSGTPPQAPELETPSVQPPPPAPPAVVEPPKPEPRKPVLSP